MTDGPGVLNPVTIINSASSPVPVAINFYEQVNAQTGTSYTFLSSDWGKLVTFSNGSAIAATLPQANSDTFPNGYYFDVVNLGVGALTITPTTSTIQGGATLVLSTGEGARIVSDGTDYFYQAGTSTADPTVVKTTGTQTIGGAKTFSSAVTVNPTTNQLVLGVTNTTTINSVAPAASRVVTIPDAGGASSFVLTLGTQTLAGATTFSNATVKMTNLPTSDPAVAGALYTTAGAVFVSAG